MPKVKVFISIGLEGRQWLACALICAMLSPVSSLPVSASVGFNGENTGQFEPVNEQLPIWTRARRNLNVRLELWSASLRNEEIFGDDENDNEKKDSADKKKKGKKGVGNEERIKSDIEKSASTAASPDLSPQEKNNLKTGIANSQEKDAPAEAKNAAPLNIKNKTS
ncbi:MAG TPA: hypothetical protein VGB00_13435, partial [Pyrinomonadaceae bacterium]